MAALDAAKTLTFKEEAASYIASHRAGWRNAKHAAQWESTLATHAEPVLGRLSIQANFGWNSRTRYGASSTPTRNEMIEPAFPSTAWRTSDSSWLRY
jgi:Phage integrase central domain